MKTFQTVFALLLASGVASGQQYVISTVAGIPGAQQYFGDGGPATSAQLDKPFAMAVDSKGNFYFGDYYTFVVREVTASTGNIATVSGNGLNGWVDGAQTTSQIGYVKGLAPDTSGNLYIADYSNCRIRKVDSSLNTTTVAGTGVCGYSGDGGAATAAQLFFPSGIALDKAGNIYEVESSSSVVRKIDSSGKISTIAGTGSWGSGGDGGPASKANLAGPVGLAVDSAGNIYIADTGNASIRKITTDGNIRSIATNVTATSISVDAAGDVFFVDGVTPVVMEVLATGSVITVAGTGASGFGGDAGQSTLAQLDHPGGVAVAANGNVYVSDTNNEVIRVLTPVAFSVGAVTNAASGVQAGVGQGAVAPGEIVAVFGNGIGPATLTSGIVSKGALGSQISGASVYFNNIAAPLLYVSAGLSAAIVPYEVAGLSTVNVAVLYQGNSSSTTVVPVTNAAPGIFTANASGSGQASAVNLNGTINNTANPVRIGGFISLYITGAGQTSPASVNGQVATATATQQLPVTVTIGGISAVVSYAGAAPSLVAGVTQINVQVPSGVAVGSAVPVAVKVGGVAAQAGVTIAVSN